MLPYSESFVRSTAMLSVRHCDCRVAVFAMLLYPTISDRVLRTKDRECKFEQSENYNWSLVIAIMGNHVPCIIIVSCYALVAAEMRKLARTRPHNVIADPHPGNSASSRHQVGASHQARSSSNGHSGNENGGRRQESGRNAQDAGGMCAVAATTNRSVAGDGNNETEVDSRTARVGPNESTGTRHLPKRSPAVGQPVDTTTTAMNRERKVFVTLSYIVMSYVICWFPYHIVFDYSIFRPELVSDFLFNFTFWLTYINSALNPFLYAFTMPDNRKAIIRMITCKYKNY